MFLSQIAKIGGFEKSAILIGSASHDLETFQGLPNESRELPCFHSHGFGDIFVDAGEKISHLCPGTK